MNTFWQDYFQIWGESPKSIRRIWWVLFTSSIPPKILALQYSVFFGKLVQMSNFGRLKSENGHVWIDYFQIIGKSLKSIFRIWWALFRSSITRKKICSPIQCFLCKLVQISNFGRLKSGNGHILDRLFPNLRQIPKFYLAYMVSIIEELHYHSKDLLSNVVLFL